MVLLSNIIVLPRFCYCSVQVCASHMSHHASHYSVRNMRVSHREIDEASFFMIIIIIIITIIIIIIQTIGQTLCSQKSSWVGGSTSVSV